MFAIWTFSKFLLNKIFYYFFHTQKKIIKIQKHCIFFINCESLLNLLPSQNIAPLPKFCPKLLLFFFSYNTKLIKKSL